MAVVIPEIAALAVEGAEVAAPWIAETAVPAIAEATAGGGLLRNIGAGLQWVGRGFKGAPKVAGKAPKASLGARVKSGAKNAAGQVGVYEAAHAVDNAVNYATGTTDVGADTLRMQGNAANRMANFYTGAGQ